MKQHYNGLPGYYYQKLASKIMLIEFRLDHLGSAIFISKLIFLSRWMQSAYSSCIRTLCSWWIITKHWHWIRFHQCHKILERARILNLRDYYLSVNWLLSDDIIPVLFIKSSKYQKRFCKIQPKINVFLTEKRALLIWQSSIMRLDEYTWNWINFDRQMDSSSCDSN